MPSAKYGDCALKGLRVPRWRSDLVYADPTSVKLFAVSHGPALTRSTTPCGPVLVFGSAPALFWK